MKIFIDFFLASANEELLNNILDANISKTMKMIHFCNFVFNINKSLRIFIDFHRGCRKVLEIFFFSFYSSLKHEMVNSHP